MNKEFVVCICLSVVGGGGYFASKQYAAHQAKAAVVEQQKQVALKAAANQPTAVAQKPLSVAQIEEKRRLEADAASRQKQLEDQASKQGMAAEFKALKVSAILLGSPSLAIINKKNYAEGDDVVLANGKRARITRINPDGIVLTSGATSFQIDLPTARDLGNASR